MSRCTNASRIRSKARSRSTRPRARSARGSRARPRRAWGCFPATDGEIFIFANVGMIARELVEPRRLAAGRRHSRGRAAERREVAATCTLRTHRGSQRDCGGHHLRVYEDASASRSSTASCSSATSCLRPCARSATFSTTRSSSSCTGSTSNHTTPTATSRWPGPAFRLSETPRRDPTTARGRRRRQ